MEPIKSLNCNGQIDFVNINGIDDALQGSSYFGTSISVSSDGTIMAVGGPEFNVTSGQDEGAVFVYQYNGITWAPLGGQIDYINTNTGISSTKKIGFGGSVSLSSDGKILGLMGASGFDVTTNQTYDEGAVFVYQYNGSSWIPLGTRIDYINTNTGISYSEDPYFGTSVSLSSDGTILAVGANGFNVTSGQREGAAFVYQYNGSSWIPLGGQIDYVNLNTGISSNANSNFGTSVSLSSDGTILAVGARTFDVTSNQTYDEGAAFVYQYNGSSWISLGGQIDYINTNTGISYNEDSDFGSSVSLSSDGTILAVGARSFDVTSGQNYNEGAVFVYQYNGSSWVPLGGKIDFINTNNISYLDSYANFGNSLSLSSDGTILAVGASGFITGSYNSGAAFVYQYNGGSWIPLGGKIDYEVNPESYRRFWFINKSFF